MHVAQMLVDAHDAQPRWRVLGSLPLSAVIHAAALRLLLGRQAQLPCDGTKFRRASLSSKLLALLESLPGKYTTKRAVWPGTKVW
jgi:hypothetical protein